MADEPKIDAWQRRLRVAASLVFLGSFVWLIVRATVGEPLDLATIAFLIGADIGALFVLLGFEGAVRIEIPFLGSFRQRRKDDE